MYVMFVGELTATPTFCLSAIISDKGDYIIEKRRHNCSSKLEWFVCKTGKNGFLLNTEYNLAFDSFLLHFHTCFYLRSRI